MVTSSTIGNSHWLQLATSSHPNCITQNDYMAPPLCDACFGVWFGTIATFEHVIRYMYTLLVIMCYGALQHNAKLLIVIGDDVACPITKHEGLRFRPSLRHVTRFRLNPYAVCVTRFPCVWYSILP